MDKQGGQKDSATMQQSLTMRRGSLLDNVRSTLSNISIKLARKETQSACSLNKDVLRNLDEKSKMQAGSRVDAIKHWIDHVDSDTDIKEVDQSASDSSGKEDHVHLFPQAPTMNQLSVLDIQRKASNIPSVILVSDDANDDMQQVLVTGDVDGTFIASESAHRICHVRSMLLSDSKGNILKPIEMSTQGRYQTHRKDDQAFRKINMNELNTIHDRSGRLGSCSELDADKSSILRGRAKSGRPSQIGRQSDLDDGEDDADSITSADSLTESVAMDDMAEGKPDMEATPSTSKPAGGGKLTISTIARMRTWKGKLGNASRTFAKDPVHKKMISKHIDQVCAEVPLPLIISIFEEIFPVIQGTVKCYQRELGRNHTLTEEAIVSLELMKKKFQVISSDL